MRLLSLYLSCRRAFARKQIRTGAAIKKQKKGDSLAAVTPLVRGIFDSMFQGQIDEKGSASKKRRCGICEVIYSILFQTTPLYDGILSIC
jgi:hypothetical protein